MGDLRQIVDDPAIESIAGSVLESFGVDGAKRLLQRVTTASEGTGGIRFRNVRKRTSLPNDLTAQSQSSSAADNSLAVKEKDKEKEKVAQKEKEKEKEKREIKIEREIKKERNKNIYINNNNNYNNTISPEISENNSLSINSDIRTNNAHINSDAISKSLRNRYIRFLSDAMCDEGLAIEVRLRAGQELSKLLGWAGMADDEIRRVADADPSLWVQAIELAVAGLGLGGSRYSEIARALAAEYLGVSVRGGANTSGSREGVARVSGPVDPVEYIHGSGIGAGADSKEQA